MYRNFFKHFLDLVIAAIGMLVISPILLLITMVLFFANGGKPFFYQERPGKNARIFKLYKFRTMNDGKDAEGRLLPDAKRITKIGRIIRSLSLDELPQLWNVLKGDMSLIGPRPLLIQYLPLYNKRQARRHELRPGITGWAQVSGRNTISWEEKFEYDFYYVENLSFALDRKILWLTFLKVIKREGINDKDGGFTRPFGEENSVMSSEYN